MAAPPTITCVDCGGLCHLLTVADDRDVFEDGMIVAAYRCEDCLDRWDIELLDEDMVDDSTDVSRGD